MKMTQYKCNSSNYIVYIDYTSSSKYILYNKLENRWPNVVIKDKLIKNGEIK